MNIFNPTEHFADMSLKNGFFITGSEDGTVSKYSLETGNFEEILVRTTLPVRDVALSPNGAWVAVASEYVFKYWNKPHMLTKK